MLEYFSYIYGLLTGFTKNFFDSVSIILDFIVMIPTPMLVLFSFAIAFFLLRLFS